MYYLVHQHVVVGGCVVLAHFFEEPVEDFGVTLEHYPLILLVHPFSPNPLKFGGNSTYFPPILFGILGDALLESIPDQKHPQRETPQSPVLGRITHKHYFRKIQPELLYHTGINSPRIRGEPIAQYQPLEGV